MGETEETKGTKETRGTTTKSGIIFLCGLCCLCVSASLLSLIPLSPQAQPNLLSKGVRCGLDKEIATDGTYYAYFPFVAMIERSQMTPFHNKLREGLHLNKMSINSTLVQKLLMSALLSNATLVDDIYAVGIVYGAEAVGYDY